MTVSRLSPQGFNVDPERHKLYQQALLAHHRHPIGFKKIISVSHEHEGVNPACGDEITVQVSIEGGKVSALAFHGDSCAICRASASIMCEQLVGLPIENSLQLSAQISNALQNNIAMIGGLAESFSPLLSVQKFPVRKQCALLPWITFQSAVNS